MAAIKDTALAKYKWILEVRPAWDTWAFSRLASVRALIANLDTTNQIDIKADDTGSVFKITDVQSSVECSMLEVFDRDLLALLFTWTSTEVSWTPVSITWEALWTWWTVWTPIELANYNWAWTEVANIVIDADWTPLVLDTDYAVYVDWWKTFITPLTAQTWVLDADYDYTPNESETIVISIDSVEVKSFEVRITATQDWKDRTIDLSSASFESTYWLSFSDVITAWDITWAAVSFKANKGSTLTVKNEIL